MEWIEIRNLSPKAFSLIGMKLDPKDSLGGGDWTCLSYYCSSTSHIETKEIEENAFRNGKSPTSVVLEQWVKQDATACVKDLIDHLLAMKRLDVIQVIKELWEDNLLGRETCSRPTYRPYDINTDVGSSCSFQHGPPSASSGGQSTVNSSECRSEDLTQNSPMSSVMRGEAASPCVQHHPFDQEPHQHSNWLDRMTSTHTTNACKHGPQSVSSGGKSTVNSSECRSVDLTQNSPMSSVIRGETASPCVQQHRPIGQEPPQHSSWLGRMTRGPQNNMTYSASFDPNDSQYSYDSNMSCSTWPKHAGKTLVSISPRSWPIKPSEQPTGSAWSPLEARQRPGTSGNSVAPPVNIYKYDGPGLVSQEPNYKGHVFITYSAVSSKFIPSIHNALQMEGYSVLTDVKRSVLLQPESKTTEEDFQAMLVKGVKNCQFVLCLLCEDYIHELKGQSQSKKLMNIQFINKLMENEFKDNGKKNVRFIPFCLSQNMSLSSLPPYLINSPVEIQDKFVTLINQALGKQNSNLVIHRVENKTKKSKLKRFLKKF